VLEGDAAPLAAKEPAANGLRRMVAKLTDNERDTLIVTCKHVGSGRWRGADGAGGYWVAPDPRPRPGRVHAQTPGRRPTGVSDRFGRFCIVFCHARMGIVHAGQKLATEDNSEPAPLPSRPRPKPKQRALSNRAGIIDAELGYSAAPTIAVKFTIIFCAHLDAFWRAPHQVSVLAGLRCCSPLLRDRSALISYAFLCGRTASPAAASWRRTRTTSKSVGSSPTTVPKLRRSLDRASLSFALRKRGSLADRRRGPAHPMRGARDGDE
jgi:hypothetical protein